MNRMEKENIGVIYAVIPSEELSRKLIGKDEKPFYEIIQAGAFANILSRQGGAKSIKIDQEIWDKAHKEINKRLLNGNRGKYISKRDTKDKIKCKCCGKPFYICHSKKKGSAINIHPYYICSTKKIRE